MNVKKKYAKVAKEFEAKNYDAALKLLYKMRAHEKDFYFLEAAIFCGLKDFFKEYRALKKLMPFLSRSSPEDKKVYHNYLNRLGVCCSQLGLIDESLKAFLQVINNTRAKDLLYYAIDYVCFNMNTKVDIYASDLRSVYDKFKSSFTFEPFPKQFYNHEKIRVGFLSGDFCNHVVMKWSWALLTKLNKDSFETYCYSNNIKVDEITKQLRASVEGWRDIYALTDEATAKLIREDEIDILFDLSGHTENNRLGVLAYRPATVQISGIGFTSSTGLETVDYFLTDEYCLGNSAPYFTENFIAMSHTHICYTPFGEISLKPTTEPPCVKNGYVTFGSFNQYRKITDSILIAWKRILDAVPNSRLLLKNQINSTKESKELVSKRLKNLGFDLARVELRGYSDKHPLDYEDIDIALDTFPYTGVTTTLEALFMNVPVISMYGDRHATRCGLSILTNIGLKELAVASYDDYIKWAVMLAGNWEWLSILRQNLQRKLKQSPLMDWSGYVREMEQTFIDVLNNAKES